MRRIVIALSCLMLLGPLAAEDVRKFGTIDLKPHLNQKRGENMGSGAEGNNLARLPGGKQTFGGVDFVVEDGIIQLGSKVVEKQPGQVAGLKVDRNLGKLHILHATCFGGGPNKEGNPWFVKDGTTIGEYRVTFEDKSAVNIPIVYGEDVRDWFYVGGELETARGKVVWNGENDRATAVGAKIRLYVTTWTNPKPDKKVVTIDYIGRKDETVAAPFCVAITVED